MRNVYVISMKFISTDAQGKLFFNVISNFKNGIYWKTRYQLPSVVTTVVIGGKVYLTGSANVSTL